MLLKGFFLSNPKDRFAYTNTGHTYITLGAGNYRFIVRGAGGAGGTTAANRSSVAGGVGGAGGPGELRVFNLTLTSMKTVDIYVGEYGKTYSNGGNGGYGGLHGGHGGQGTRDYIQANNSVITKEGSNLQTICIRMFA